jgi:AraC-like DNA-binding protein/mannose-6-phosphate isomerase-like protein (cupin superfamily)
LRSVQWLANKNICAAIEKPDPDYDVILTGKERLMKFRPIIVDNKLQELTEHGTEGFPMSMDEQHVSYADCHEVLHWHYEIQIVLVTRGSVLFRTPEEEFLIREGQGIFFNSGCLHEAVPTEDEDSVYISVNFHPNLIFGQNSSVIRRDYVDPVLFSSELQVIPLASETWHLEICAMLRRLAQINDEQAYGYEIAIKAMLSSIWLLIVQNNRAVIEEDASVTFAGKQRMRTLLHFIHRNYMDRISLEDIANAAHISKGECCRMFQRIQHTTPFLYLISFRVAQSIKLLSTTDQSIADIAQQVGFGSSSYYNECFKKEMHCTPSQYRKNVYSAKNRESGAAE